MSDIHMYTTNIILLHFIPFSFDAIDEVVENFLVVTALEDSLNKG